MGIAVVMLLISPLIKKLMHQDVHADVSKEGADPSDYQGQADKLAD